MPPVKWGGGCPSLHLIFSHTNERAGNPLKSPKGQSLQPCYQVLPPHFSVPLFLLSFQEALFTRDPLFINVRLASLIVLAQRAPWKGDWGHILFRLAGFPCELWSDSLHVLQGGMELSCWVPQVAREKRQSPHALYRESIWWMLIGCINSINDLPFILPFALIMFGGER